MHDDDPTDTAGSTPPDGSISTRPPNAAADHGATSTRSTISAAGPTQTDDQGQPSPRHDCDPECVSTAPLADSQADTIDHLPAGLADAVTRAWVPVGSSPESSPPSVPGYDGFSPLGEGGMGVVWKARQAKLNRLVALKMVLGDQRAGSKELIRFLAEAEAVAAVKHPHVVQVYEYGDAHGRPFLAMEYLPGGSLTDRLIHAGRLDAKAAAELVETLAGAVQAAHDQGIVHRDLKPANVLYDEQGRPRVTDFGLAKRSGSGDLTATQAVMGTPAYMAPEQARGDTKFVGPQADVYSLGVILYECLTGSRPFADPDRFALLRKVVEEEPVRPGKRVPGLSRDVELICLKCLAKDPAERYPTARALAADLARFAAGEPVSVRSAGMVERAAKWARRRPTLAAAYMLGLLALLLGGLGSIAAWQWWASERLLEKIERLEYGRTIQIAHELWRKNKIAAAQALLEGTRAELRGWEWSYVHRLCHSDALTLKAKTATYVGSSSFSPDGSRVITCGSDTYETGSRVGTAKVWDATTGTVILTMRGHTQIVHSASFSPDGSRLVTAGWDQTVNVWDATTGDMILSLKWSPRWVSPASFSPDGSRVVGADGDGAVRIWDAKTGAAVLTLEGNTGSVSSASFSPDGSRVVTANGDKTTRLWDARTGLEILTLKGHTGIVERASFSPDGSRVVTIADGTAKIWDANTGAELLTLDTVETHIGVASFSPDGSGVVAAGSDGTVRVWDVRTRNAILTLKGHTDAVYSVSFSPDGARLVTMSKDGTGKVWDARTGAEILTLKGVSGTVNASSFTPDGSRVVASGEQAAHIWVVGLGSEVLTLRGHSADVTSASFNADSSRVVTASVDSTAIIWDTKSGAVVITLKGHTDAVSSASFNADGSRVVTMSADGTARVWDAETGSEVLCLKEIGGRLFSVGFSADGSRVITASLDGTVSEWDAMTGVKVRIHHVSGSFENGVVFSSDGSQGMSWVTASDDPTIRVWNAKNRTYTTLLQGHTNQVLSGSFAPDGTRIVTGSRDTTARLWDTRSGAEVLTLEGHTGNVLSVSFSPDMSRVVTASQDGTAKVWDSRPINREFLTRGPASPRASLSNGERPSMLPRGRPPA